MHRQSQLKIQAQVVWVRQAQVFHSFNGPKAEMIFIFSNTKIPPRSRGADMLSFALMGWHLRCPKCDLDQQKFDKFALKSPFGFFLTKDMWKTVWFNLTKLTSQITHHKRSTVVGEQHIKSPWWLAGLQSAKPPGQGLQRRPMSVLLLEYGLCSPEILLRVLVWCYC